jgi:Na(+)-translocating NADH:ubiquinone oxidoreductase A subunit
MKFIGGYSFKGFEGAAEPVLRDTPLPERIFLSIRDGAPSPAGLLIEPGSSVRAGEPLLSYGSNGPILPSPIGGTVEKAGDDLIVVRSSGDASFAPLESHTRAPWHTDRPAVIELFRVSGCALLFDRRFEGADSFDLIRHIIVNAVHNGPLDQKWNPDIFGDSGLHSDGLKSLGVLFPKADIALAVNRRNRTAFEKREPVEGVSLRVMSDRYPQEFPELLARDICGVAQGASDPSVLVVPYEVMIQAAECMTRGKPLIDRIVCVAGPGVSNPGWRRIRIGASFDAIGATLLKSTEYGPWRVIRGGVFTGISVAAPDEPLRFSDREITVIHESVSREMFGFLNPGFDFDSFSRLTVSSWFPIMKRRLDSGVHGGVRPCVQCNFCDEVCPVGIFPQLIWKLAGADLIEESFRLRPHHCISCGLCDYVCPSKIDLSKVVRRVREAYLKERTE